MTYDVIPRRSPEESCMTPANTSDHCFRMAERATEFAPPFLTLEVPGFALTGVAPATKRNDGRGRPNRVSVQSRLLTRSNNSYYTRVSRWFTVPVKSSGGSCQRHIRLVPQQGFAQSAPKTSPRLGPGVGGRRESRLAWGEPNAGLR
jgi:hypothetical protein